MTLEDLADHMRRVRLGEVAPSPDEVDPEAVQRWEELLRRLATPKPVYCPACEQGHRWQREAETCPTHVGCYYA